MEEVGKTVKREYCHEENDEELRAHVKESTYNKAYEVAKAGLGWITKLTDSKVDLIDKELLQTQKEKGVNKKLRGFKMIDRGIPRHDYKIFNSNDELIGHVTSGTQSPILKQGIGMGYIVEGFNKVDQEIYIEIRNRKLKAKIVKTPFI